MSQILPDFYGNVIGLAERANYSTICRNSTHDEIVIPALSFPNFLRVPPQYKFLCLFVFTLLTSSCAASSGSIKIAEDLKYKDAIRSAYSAYVSAYGCQSPLVTAVVGTQIEGSVPTGSTVEEQVEGSEISFFQQKNEKDVKNITEHALTHACKKKDSNKQFVNTFDLEPGATVVGVDGFMLDIQKSDGSRTKFTKIEEGVAEALAINLDSEYKVNSREYKEIGELAQKLMEIAHLKPSEVAKMVQSSNLKDFISAVYRKPVEQLTEKDYKRITRAFNDVYSGYSTPQQVLEGMVANPFQ